MPKLEKVHKTSILRKGQENEKKSAEATHRRSVTEHVVVDLIVDKERAKCT